MTEALLRRKPSIVNLTVVVPWCRPLVVDSIIKDLLLRRPDANLTENSPDSDNLRVD
jgi:hypothetical protein